MATNSTLESKKKPKNQGFDEELYGSNNDRFADEIVELGDSHTDERLNQLDQKLLASQRKNASLGAGGGSHITQLVEETKMEGANFETNGDAGTIEADIFKNKTIANREDQYHKQRFNRGRLLSPEREDYFATESEQRGKKNKKDQPVL